MKIKAFKIENFKSVSSLEIFLDKDLSVLTGANNCGKTTILEALALWIECFGMLIHKAERNVRDRYKKGNYVFGVAKKYFNWENVHSIHCSTPEDVFPERDTKKTILLSATLVNDSSQEMKLGFSINSVAKYQYAIQLVDESSLDYSKFNSFFKALPDALALYYASPIAMIALQEDFETDPKIEEKIRQRRSVEIIRNRLYRLYHTTKFTNFKNDLSYVLFGTRSNKIDFSCPCDINKDKRVVVNYKTEENPAEKDVSMLGSGTIQLIEILLNLYHTVESKKDLNLVLLDEPDSHIHRDVQKRLIEILQRVTDNNQLIVTSHNESLIRNTPLKNLFHIDGNGSGTVKCMYKTELPKLDNPHFKGLYPAFTTPLIRNVNCEASGLDFVSAIEAEKIIFVEGDDDARLLYKLMQTNVANRNRKVMFWVLGGITEIMDNIAAYKTLFSAIKNRVTLWEKACLVCDRDRMIDEHFEQFRNAMKNKFGIDCYAASLYTQESVALADYSILSKLLIKMFDLKGIGMETLTTALQQSELELSSAILARYTNVDNHVVQQYKGMYLNKLVDKDKFGINIRFSDVDLANQLKAFYSSQPIHRLATKNDVAEIINKALQKVGAPKDYQAESFYSLVQNVDSSCLFEKWKPLITFLSI